MLAGDVLDRLARERHEVGVGADALADGEPLGVHRPLLGEVGDREILDRVDGARGDRLVLLRRGVDGDVGELLDADERALLPLVERVGPGRSTPAIERGGHRLLLDAPDDAIGIEEVEHVGEVGDHDEERRGHEDHREDDAHRRAEVVRHRDRAPDGVDAGDDEEAEHAEVGAIAEEEIGDARGVAGGGELHDDRDDGDDDAEDRRHHLRHVAERVLQRVDVEVEQQAERVAPGLQDGPIDEVEAEEDRERDAAEEQERVEQRPRPRVGIAGQSHARRIITPARGELPARSPMPAHQVPSNTHASAPRARQARSATKVRLAPVIRHARWIQARNESQ